MDHICTSESFIVQELEPVKAVCPICCQETTQRITWVSVLCMNCRRDFGPDYTLGYIVMKRREYCGKTRRQWSKLIGYTVESIRYYEYHKPSEIYLRKTEELVKKIKPVVGIAKRMVDEDEKPNSS